MPCALRLRLVTHNVLTPINLQASISYAGKQMQVYLYLLVAGFHTAIIKSPIIKPAETGTNPHCDEMQCHQT